MATVERGNVVLQIADDDIQRYLDKGYSVTDGYGNILQQTLALSTGELHQLIAKKDAEIAELKEQIAALNAYLDELEGVPEEEAVVVDAQPEEISPPTPKRGRKKKVTE